MRLLLFALLFSLAVGCGPGRDPSFHRVVQFSAVGKLAIAGNHVYFAEDRALKRVGKQGGAVEIITPVDVNDFAAAAGHVYAATTGGIDHHALATAGTIASTRQISTDAALAIAADATGVAWVTCSTVVIAASDGSGQIRVPLTRPCSNANTRLALDSSTVYGMDAMGQWLMSRAGGSFKPIANERCQRIEAGGGWLYCSDREMGLRRFTTRVNEVESVLDGQVHAFAIGATRIYAGMGQDLISSPRNTRTQEVLGTYAAISAIALDEKDVFFVNTEGPLGLLLRTAQ